MPLRLILALLCLSAVEVEASSNLRLLIDPPLETVRPNHDEAHLTLLSEGKGASSKTVRWNLIVELPPPGILFSTDFPWIEGKRLLDIEFVTEGGKAQWSMVFPIRGRYEIRVETEIEGEAPGQTTFPLVIREDPARLLYLVLSLAGVFLLGCLIGWAVPRSRVFLAVLFFSLTGVAAQAQLDVNPEKVGEITPMNLVLPDSRATGIDFSIVKTEDQQRLFHIEDVTVMGKTTWNYHFFDGSVHRIRMAIQYPGFTARRVVEKETHVEARPPPRTVVLTTYGIFLLPLIVGWFVGRTFKKSKKGRKIPVPSV